MFLHASLGCCFHHTHSCEAGVEGKTAKCQNSVDHHDCSRHHEHHTSHADDEEFVENILDLPGHSQHDHTPHYCDEGSCVFSQSKTTSILDLLLKRDFVSASLNTANLLFNSFLCKSNNNSLRDQCALRTHLILSIFLL